MDSVTQNRFPAALFVHFVPQFLNLRAQRLTRQVFRTQYIDCIFLTA
jgi:hypothetical protein